MNLERGRPKSMPSDLNRVMGLRLPFNVTDTYTYHHGVCDLKYSLFRSTLDVRRKIIETLEPVQLEKLGAIVTPQ